MIISHLNIFLLETVILTPFLVTGAKILALPPPIHAGSNSHLYLMTNIGDELISRGHDVTILIYGDMPNHSKIKEIRLPAPFDKEYFVKYNQAIQEELPNMFKGEVRIPSANFFEPWMKDCETVLSSKELHNTLRKTNFDLAIIDHVYKCGFPLARLLGIPYVVLEGSGGVSFLTEVPVPSPLSYVPIFSAHNTDDMTFLQRLKNTITFYMISYFMEKMVVQPFNEIKEKVGVLPGTSISHLSRQAEFWLINNDFSLEFPRPMLPNTAFIGGMTSSPPQPLPQELKAFVDGAGDYGVVVISFGSGLDLKYVPELVNTILEAMSRIPQRVVWSSKFLPPKDPPKNVKIFSWIPQNDLLGHSQTKVLITHGGANSVFEAVYHGVPTLVIPSTMDAMEGALRLEKKGMGLYLKAPSLTASRLQQAITNLIQDSRFMTAAKKMSSVMRDQPQTPKERAAFWIEHIIKHGGSGRHLRVHGSDMPTYAYYNIDVYACLIVIAIVVTVLVIFILKCIWVCICKGKAKKQKRN